MGKHDDGHGGEAEHGYGGAGPLYAEGTGGRRWEELAYPVVVGAVPVVALCLPAFAYFLRALRSAAPPSAPWLQERLGWSSDWTMVALSLEMSLVFLLVVFGLWAGLAWIFRPFGRIDRRKDGFYRARRVRVAGTALARYANHLDAAVEEGARVDAVFAGGGMFESPADDAALAFLGITMGLVGLVGSFGLTYGEGLQGLQWARWAFVLPLLVYLAGLRHGRWAPAFTLLALFSAYGAATIALLDEVPLSAQLGFADLAFAAAFGAAFLRWRRDWRAHATPRFLTRAGERWFVVDLDATEVAAHEVDPKGLPTLVEDTDGFLLEVPVEPSGTLPVRLAHLGEVAALHRCAPAHWEIEPPVPRARPARARRALQALGAAGSACLLGGMAFLALLYGLELTVRLPSWSSGNPRPLHEASRRVLTLIHRSAVGHAFAAVTSLDLGRFGDARRHAEAALQASAGYGQAARMARRVLHGPALEEPGRLRETEAWWDRVLELEAGARSLERAPEGWTLEAWRHYQLARRLHEFFREGPAPILLTREYLPVLLHLEAAREADPRLHEEVLRLLHGILSGSDWHEAYGERDLRQVLAELSWTNAWRVRLSFDLSEFLPETERDRVRGRAYFAAGNFPAALPYLEGVDSAEDRLRFAFAVLRTVCREETPEARLRAARERLRPVLGTPEGATHHARVLDAWLVAASGDLDEGLSRLTATARDPEAAPLALATRLFLRLWMGDLRIEGVDRYGPSGPFLPQDDPGRLAYHRRWKTRAAAWEEAVEEFRATTRSRERRPSLPRPVWLPGDTHQVLERALHEFSKVPFSETRRWCRDWRENEAAREARLRHR